MKNIIKKSITNLRMLGLDQVVHNKTGHPGMVLSAAPLLHSIYLKYLNTSLTNLKWINRDRFVLSAGHGSALMYSLLHIAGFNLSIEDLKKFRQINSITPGHPELNVTPGIDVSTGPLGQGLAMAVGLAVAEKHLGAKFNKEDHEIINHKTFVICGDGDLEEGVALEAIQLAGIWKLNKLIVLYDSNDYQLDTNVEQVKSLRNKEFFDSSNWNYILVKNGNNVDTLNKAIDNAVLSDKPTLIECKTIIGEGHKKQATIAMHGNPFSKEDMVDVYRYFGWNHEPFYVDDEVKKMWVNQFQKKGEEKFLEWQKISESYRNLYPKQWIELFEESKVKPEDFQELLHASKEATRNSSALVFKKLQKLKNNLFGGSADLVAATKIQGFDGDFSALTSKGNNLLFGVREFAMGSISNGITLHGGLRGFNSTFVVFSDYMKNSIRMAALQECPTLFLLTHDSIAAGYDGPTHQPIEQIAGLRATPNSVLFRPADLKETIGAYVYAYNETKKPSILLFCRQDVEQYEKTCWNKTQKGGYIVFEENKEENLDAIIIATGSELAYGINFAKTKIKNVRVISMPSTQLFDTQLEIYKESILPHNFEKVISIEASHELGWHKYTGKNGLVISANQFGASGFGDDVLKIQGFEQNEINKKIINYLQ